MATQYSVKVRTTCTTCENGVIYNPVWTACTEGVGETASNEEILDWFNDNDKSEASGDLPPEELPCPSCEGVGYTNSECSLEDAPPFAALTARLDATAELLVKLPFHVEGTPCSEPFNPDLCSTECVDSAYCVSLSRLVKLAKKLAYP